MKYTDLSAVFEAKYRNENSDWGGHSGSGSLAYYTISYRAFVEQFISLNRIRSIVDIGCGDWQFSKFMNYDDILYTGYDIAQTVIDHNNNSYSRDNIKFLAMPCVLDDIMPGDLLIMKDVLQHLPDEMILNFKNSVFNKFKYCLITNSFNKLNTKQNIDISPGNFRCLDLTKSPYNFCGTYVLEFFSPLWETIRVLLLRPS